MYNQFYNEVTNRKHFLIKLPNVDSLSMKVAKC